MGELPLGTDDGSLVMYELLVPNIPLFSIEGTPEWAAVVAESLEPASDSLDITGDNEASRSRMMFAPKAKPARTITAAVISMAREGAQSGFPRELAAICL